MSMTAPRASRDTLAAMPPAAEVTLAILAAYLVGSIPFGLLIGLARGIDVREHGSGNIGATNVRRVVGKPWGNLALALDVLKGAVPTLAFGAALGFLSEPTLPPGDAFAFIAIAAASILGHMFPLYLRFKGGKGVATGLGALSALWPVVTPAAFGALATWIIVVRTTRYVSVASCAAALALPLGVIVFTLAFGWPDPDAPLEARLGAWPFLLATAALGALVIFKHRANLARVRAGTEPRIGQSRAGQARPSADAGSRTPPGSKDAEKPPA